MAISHDDHTAEALVLVQEGDRRLPISVTQAVDSYERATQLDPHNHEAWGKLAFAQEKLEDYAAMAESSRRATELAPQVARYWQKRGRALFELGQLGDAKAAFGQCIERDPSILECQARLADAALATGDDPLAARSYARALELAGHADDLTLWRIRIGSLQLAQRHGSAAEQLAAIEAAEPFSDQATDALFTLGRAYAALDLPEDPTSASAAPTPKVRGQRLLRGFVRSRCQGQPAPPRREQCEAARALLETSP